MPILQIILGSLVAALAVIGAYGVLRETMLSAIASREVTAAVVLWEAVDEVALDILLDEANRHPKRRRGQRVALILSPDAFAGMSGADGALLPVMTEIIDRYRAELFVTISQVP